MSLNLLVFVQDPGSTRCMLPVLRSLNSDGALPEHRLVIHPTAKPVFERFGCAPVGERISEDWPLSVERWKSILSAMDISHVWCTLSSPYRDQSNVHLIVACRDLGIATLGFMDHWKGFDRFYDLEGRPLYFPDWIGCIDAFSREDFRKRSISEARLHIVGQPVLETAWRRRLRRSETRGKLRILLVSQPNANDRSFQSVFLQSGPEGRIIDRIAGMLGENKELIYRPHPKEVASGDLPPGVRHDPSPDTAAVVRNYDVVVGLDSIMLVEAALMGSRVVILDLLELSDQVDVRIPYEYGHRVARIEEIGEVCSQDAATDQANVRQGLSALSESIQNSLERSVNFVLNYLKINPRTSPHHA